jgi:hypothetical protein
LLLLGGSRGSHVVGEVEAEGEGDGLAGLLQTATALMEPEEREKADRKEEET